MQAGFHLDLLQWSCHWKLLAGDGLHCGELGPIVLENNTRGWKEMEGMIYEGAPPKSWNLSYL